MKLLHTIALTAAALILFFGAHGLVDKIDQDANARADYKRWVRESCLPLMAGESAAIVNDGKQMHCRIYSTASISTGMAPKITRAAVIEIEAPL